MNAPRPRLLLVSPRHDHRNLWALKEVGQMLGKPVATVPLALPLLAALTPAPWDVRIVDEEMDPVPLGDRFDLVGITAISTNATRGFALADSFRAAGVRVVMGGPYASCRVDDALRHVDAVVVGEAEETWAPLLADVAANRLQPVYRAPRLPPAEMIPAPRWDLVDTRRLMGLNVHVSRGCPHHCDFCLVHNLYGRRPRYRPVDAVVAEVASLPLRTLSFVDDNLTAAKPYARELMARLKPLHVQWSGLASLEVTRDGDLLRDMAEAGCNSLVLGFESLSPEGLAEARKTQFRIDEYQRAVEALHRAGIHCIGAFVLGFDADTPDSFRAVREFSLRSGLSYLMLNVLTVFDGTDLERRMSAEGRRIPLPPSFQNGVFPNKVSRSMTEREVFDRFLDLMGGAYSWEDLRSKSRQAFALGGFTHRRQGGPSAWAKFRLTFRLLRAFLLARDRAKRALFLDLVRMARAGTMTMESVAQYLMMVEAFRHYVDDHLRDREDLWRRYCEARDEASRKESLVATMAVGPS